MRGSGPPPRFRQSTGRRGDESVRSRMEFEESLKEIPDPKLKEYLSQRTPSVSGEITAQDIKRQIIKDAMEYPLTLLPFAAAVLCALYLFFFSPFIGGGTYALFGVAASIGIGILSFGWRWLIAGKSYFSQKTKEIMAFKETAAQEQQNYELDMMNVRLERDLHAINSQDGLKALTELQREYRLLIDALRNHGESDFVSMKQIRNLAVNIYKQGLAILANAAEVIKAINLSDIQSLTEEIATIEKDVAVLKKSSPDNPRIKIKEDMLVSHKERLSKMQEQQLCAERLLAQADACEAALCQTRLDVGRLSIEKSEDKGREVIIRLQRAIDLAMQVQDELKKEGINA